MKKIICVLLSIAMILSMTVAVTYAEAATVIANGVYGRAENGQAAATPEEIVSNKFNWSLDSNGLFTFEAVDGATEIANQQNPALNPWQSYKDEIKKVIIPEGVTFVGGRLFEYYTNLEEIVYPESCTKLYYSAFTGCSNLSKATFPGNYTHNATEITPNMFGKLETMVFPKVEKASDLIFKEGSLNQFRKVTINGGTLEFQANNSGYLSELNLFGDIVIADGAYRPGTCYLNTIKIGKDVNVSLNSFTYNAVQTISGNINVYGVNGSYAEQLNGKYIKNRNGEDITSKTYVFHTLDGLGNEGALLWWVEGSELTIDGIGAIPDFTVDLPSGWSVFANQIRTVKISEGITKIGDYAFSGCNNIKTVILPSTVTSIGSGAFTSSNLLAIELPDTVTSVALDAFTETKICVSDKSPLKGINGYYVYKAGEVYSGSVMAVPDATATWSVYKINISGETDSVLVVGGQGNQVGAYTAVRPWQEYAADISTLVIDYGVTRIAQNMFYNNSTNNDNLSSLEEISIADTVTVIQPYAFWKLGTVTHLNLSNSITTVNTRAFDAMSKLSSLYIPASIVDFKEAAFANLGGLTSLTFEKGSKGIASQASAGDGVFANAVRLTEVVLPDGFESIGAFAFRNTGISEITIPDSVTTIDENAFGTISESSPKDLIIYASAGNTAAEEFYNKFKDYGVKLVANLASGDINEYLSWIIDKDNKLYINGTGVMPDYSLENPAPWSDYASQITYIIIDNTVTSIGAYAFAGFRAMDSFNVEENITAIGENAFLNTKQSFTLNCSTKTAVDYAVANDIAYTIGGTLSTGIKWVINNDTMTLSGEGAIPADNSGTSTETPWNNLGIRNLKKIVIENGITNIPGWSFNIATALKTVIIPDSVTSIGHGAFNESDNLEFIEIPANVEFVGGFASASDLKRIAFLSDTATIPTNVSGSRNNDVTYYVEADSAAAAQNIEEERITRETIKAKGKIEGTDADWLVSDEGTLEVYGIGDLNTVSAAPWESFVQDIKKVYIEDGITGVGANLFSGINNAYVELPNSVTELSANAFAGCESEIRVPYDTEKIDINSFDENSTILCYPNSYTLQFAEDNLKNYELRQGLRILVIGNSYSEDIAINHLWEVATHMGVEEMKIGNLMYAGRNIINVYNHIINNDTDYIYREITSGGRAVEFNGGKNNILYGITADDWDVIVIQPWFPDATYGLNGIDDGVEDGENWLNYVADYIIENATNPNMKLAFNMIWSQNQKFSGINRVGNQNYNLYSNNRPNYGNEMYDYNNIINQTKIHVDGNPRFDYILPTGTAIQNARTSYLGGLKGTTTKFSMIGGLQRDLTHIADIGMYIGSMAWIKTLIPELSIDDLTWAPNVRYTTENEAGKTVFDEDVIETAKWAASMAYENPFTVTQSDKPFRIMSYIDGNITVVASNVVRTLGYADENMTIIDDQMETDSHNGTYKKINDKDVVIIIAEFDSNNKLVKCKAVDHTLTYDEKYGIPSEDTTYLTSIVSGGGFVPTEGNKVKLMMFDSLDKITPLCEAFIQ